MATDGTAGRSAARRSPVQMALGVVYAVGALPAAGLLVALAAFAVSPTLCPDVGASYLCNGSAATVTFFALAALIAVFVASAFAVPVLPTPRRAWQALAVSLGAGAVALAAIHWVGSTWL